jgi:hypothetical protein
MSAEIKSPPGNGPYCFRIRGQICHLVSRLNPNEENKPGHRQFNISDSAEAATKRLENKSNQGCLAETLQRVASTSQPIFLSNVKECIN